MYCQKCGARNEDSAVFCRSCGMRLNSAQPQPQYQPVQPQYQPTQPQYQPTQPQYQQAQPQYQPTQPQYQQQPISPEGSTVSRPVVKYKDPVLDPIKKWILSPLFIAAVAAFSLMILLHILNSDYAFALAIEEATDILYEINAYTGNIANMLNMLNNISVFFAILEMLPGIIVAVALWYTLYTAYDKSKKGMPVSGLSVVRKVIGVVFVLDIISVVLYAVLSIIAFSNIANIGAKLPTSVFIAMLAIFMGMILRVFCINKTGELLDYIIYTIEYRKPVVPSTISTIMPFIFCGSYMCLALAGGDLSKWCGALALLGFGVLAIQYKILMQELQSIARTFESEEHPEADTSPVGEGAYNTQAGMAHAPAYQNETASGLKLKKFVPFAVIAAVILGVVIFATSYIAPDLDRRIIGTWECVDEKYEGAVMEFKRNGTVIVSERGEDEETATYTAEDGVLTLAGSTQWNYRVISSNIIEIERYYISGTWEKVYQWYRFERVD